MNTHTDKAQESKSKSISNGMSQTQRDGKSTFQFVDNRPESVVQLKLQDLADNSPQVSQLRTFQDMANNSPKAKQSAQLQSMTEDHSAHQKQPIQKKENKTGLPDELKIGIENLSGYSMDDVKVHYNSDKPAQLQAHAYAQGTDIYLGSGQEKHLPHEAWHVVQQKQGRVKPTVQMKGKVNVNDDVGLEKEADLMGEKAFHTDVQFPPSQTSSHLIKKNPIQQKAANVVQRVRDELELWEIGFTQASVGRSFTEVPQGVDKRLANLAASSDQIKKGGELPDWIQGLRVFSIKNPEGDEERIFSLDNRRLKVLNLSGFDDNVLIPVQWVDIEQVISECFKFTNRKIWEQARMTNLPTEEERTIAPTGNLLGDFFAALVATGYITNDGKVTGEGEGDVAGDWSFNQAD